MTSTDSVNDFLQGVGRQVGLALGLDDAGQCVLACAGDVRCTVSVPSASDLVVLHAEVAGVPADRREAYFEEALRLNLYGEGTRGCTLALDGSRGALVLCLVRRVAELDALGFAALLGGFITAARELKTRFADGASLPAAGTAAAASDGNGLLPNFQFRV